MMATSTEFRRVDLATSTFGDDLFNVIAASMGTSHVISSGAANGVSLSMLEVQPGDYALVSLSAATYNGYSNGQSWLCSHIETPVYSIQAGQISVISTFW